MREMAKEKWVYALSPCVLSAISRSSAIFIGYLIGSPHGGEEREHAEEGGAQARGTRPDGGDDP